ncbi:MAG: hypothetical protein GXX96_37625 [Planctomycetaceae bacterium]|nr:hypothetical protein [Planctomycetaceae bacterium]
MQLRGKTALYVVSVDGLTKMDFNHLVDALRGGMNLADVEIYDDAGEVMTARIASVRRRSVEDFEQQELLAASKMVLVDAEGNAILVGLRSQGLPPLQWSWGIPCR